MNDPLVEDLTIRLQKVDVPAFTALTMDDYLEALPSIQRQVKASILAKFAEFLRDNPDLVPSKEAILEALDKAIDLAFGALDRPVVTQILKPVVRQMILSAAGQMYDTIFTDPPIEV